MTTTVSVNAVSSTCESCGHDSPVLVAVLFSDLQLFEVCPRCAPTGPQTATRTVLDMTVLSQG